MDREAENAAERMWRQTGREDVMSDRDRAERYKTLLEDARRERDEYRFRAETAEKATAEQAKEIERLRSELLLHETFGHNPEQVDSTLKARVETLEGLLREAADTLVSAGFVTTAKKLAKALNPQQETPHA